MQVDIADRHSDCQYNKVKELVLTSYTEKVLFLRLVRHYIYMLLIQKKFKLQGTFEIIAVMTWKRPFSTECKYNPPRLF